LGSNWWFGDNQMLGNAKVYEYYTSIRIRHWTPL
jgi:hypothetical protein